MVLSAGFSKYWQTCGKVGSVLVASCASLLLAEVPKELQIPQANAKTEAEMQPYTDIITTNNVKFEMVPIKGGKFTMGSPKNEANRKEDEGPQHEVEISPFWMGKYELRWDEFEIYMLKTDFKIRKATAQRPNSFEKVADAFARPTAPYLDMSEGMGTHGYPAVNMTHYSARLYCQWLSIKTGRYYRLPTEAEWEYACRAGTSTAYFFGNDSAKLDEYAWYFDNSRDKYHKVGQKKPNAWGLYDMHGNVTEWCLDQYQVDYYKQLAGKVAKDVVAFPTTMYPNAVRGGSWDDDAERLRSAARRASNIEWKQDDCNLPHNVWFHTNAPFSGMRIVRPLIEPTAEEKAKIWDIGLDASGKDRRVTYAIDE